MSNRTTAKEDLHEAAGSTSGEQLFKVEEHGLEPIPHSERRGDPRELFWTWLGGAFNYVTLAAGALPILFGLSLWHALLAVVIGNVLGSLVFGLCAIFGPRTGTATIVNTRAALGHRGNLVPAVVSFFSAGSWVAVNSVLASFAVFALFGAFGIVLSAAAKVLVVAIVLATQMIIAIYGHALIMAVERIFAVASSIILIGILAFVLPRLDWAHGAGAELAAGTPFATWLLAMGAMFAMPLSWANYASDYSRYLPETTHWKKAALYSGLGIGTANTVGCFIGALLATLVDMTDPMANVPAILPTWYLFLFLAAALWGTVANNILNLYTAGLGLLALRVNWPRWRAVLLVGLGATAMTYYAIFSYNFMDLYAQWLILTLSLLSPWVAILLVDYRLRHGRYDVFGLHAWRQPPYWYRGGVNRPAFAIYLVGILASLSVSNSTIWASPLAVNYLGGADLSLFVGFLVTGALYYLVRRQAIRGASGDEPHAGTTRASYAATTE